MAEQRLATLEQAFQALNTQRVTEQQQSAADMNVLLQITQRQQADNAALLLRLQTVEAAAATATLTTAAAAPLPDRGPKSVIDTRVLSKVAAFTGKPEDFRLFRFRFTAYCAAVASETADELKAAAAAPTTVRSSAIDADAAQRSTQT